MKPTPDQRRQIQQVEELCETLAGYEGCDGCGLYRCPACKHIDILDHFDVMGASRNRVFCNQCHHHHEPERAPEFLQRILRESCLFPAR